MAGLDQRARRGANAGIQGQRAHAGHRVVVGQPLGAALGVGQVLFVQYLEGGFAARQLGEHGVGAGAGQAGVQQLDNDVNVPDALADGFARQVHMAGKPLDGHGRQAACCAWPSRSGDKYCARYCANGRVSAASISRCLASESCASC